jgi:hypothetical protein
VRGRARSTCGARARRATRRNCCATSASR